MKAIACTAYGPPDVLQLQEVKHPAPGHDEVLIKIQATAVTASDCIVRGFKLPRWHPMGFMMGLVIGFSKPRQPILGMVLAGDIEATGDAVKRFKTGDAVYGSTFKPPRHIRFGAYAEYVCLPEDSLITHKPPEITYEEAAAMPYGAMLAMHYLRRGKIQPGHHVLIYGASGAIGTAAVQLARHHFGAEVTGVCSTRNVPLVKSLGADYVMDYTAPPPQDEIGCYDFVFDAVGKRKKSALKTLLQRALRPGGKAISVDDGSPTHSFEDITTLTELIQAGKFRAVIDRRYPLAHMAEAHRYVDEGHKQGNVVITVTDDGPRGGKR